MKDTIENLAKAFIGESQARNRYTFYAKVAKKEGFEQIAEIFQITADNEKEHANWLFKLINELKRESSENLDEIKVEAVAPTILGNISENLKAAIAGENYDGQPKWNYSKKKQKMLGKKNMFQLLKKQKQE